MSKDSSFGVKADNSRVLMSETLNGVLDEADTLPPDLVESFVTVVIPTQFLRDKELTHVVGTLVGMRKRHASPHDFLLSNDNSKIDVVLSVKLMYDDALRFVSEVVSSVSSFEFYLGADRSQAFAGPWELSAAEMFELNPSVNMCTVALELKAK